jgi:hypothetical protein
MKEEQLGVRCVRSVLAFGLACSSAFWIACGDDDGDGDGEAGTGGEVDGGDSGSGGRSGSGGSAGGGTGGGGAGTGGTGGGGAGTGGTGGEDDGGVDEDAGDPGMTSFRDVTLDLTDFDPHVGQLMHFRVVSDDDELVALGIYDPLTDGDADIALPGSIGDGVHRLDYFADFNANGVYNPPPADHAWRLPIEASGDAELDYTHDTDFTNIAMPAFTSGEDFVLSATDMDPHVGQLFEVRVFEEDSGRLVGRYVLGEVETADFEVTLPGILESGTSYRVDFYADLSEDGNYDAPPADHAWRETAEADANGLTIEFEHNTTFTDVEF